MKSRAKMVVVETTSEGATSVGKSIIDLSSVATVGLDLAKHVFQVHGVDASGRVVVAKAIRRTKLLEFFASLPGCLVGLEACGSAQGASRRWAIGTCANCSSWARMRCCFTVSPTPIRCG